MMNCRHYTVRYSMKHVCEAFSKVKDDEYVLSVEYAKVVPVVLVGIKPYAYTLLRLTGICIFIQFFMSKI